jgi:hypothetical protein
MRLRWVTFLHYALFVYSTWAAVFFLVPDLFHAVQNGARSSQVWVISGAISSIYSCLNLSAALLIPQRKGYRYLFTVGVLNCFIIPIGTLIGAFSLITLRRPTVRSAFNHICQS